MLDGRALPDCLRSQCHLPFGIMTVCLQAHWVDPVDRFQYAWPLRPVIGVLALGADFGEECFHRCARACCAALPMLMLGGCSAFRRAVALWLGG